MIEKTKRLWHAELWHQPYDGTMLAETLPLRKTRATAVRDAQRIFRRRWDRQGKVTGFLR